MRIQQILSILLRHQDSARTANRRRAGYQQAHGPARVGLHHDDSRAVPADADAQKGAGLLLAGTPQARQRLADDLNASGRSDWSDKRERRRYLLFELLRDRTPKKLYHYSRLLGVSESTAASDLEALGPWLRKNNLSILKKPGFGVVLNGTEQNYREACGASSAKRLP